MTDSVTVQVRPGDGGWICEVEVEVGGGNTRHSVRVSPADVARWGGGSGEEEVADLVRRSFEFLLQRESPGSILPRFDLSVIQRYFPEYDQEFRR